MKKEAGLIERYGSGIRRMINICKDHRIIEPVFEEKHNGFMVTILKQKLKETDALENVTKKVPYKIPHRVPENLTENQQVFLKLISQDSTVSMSQMT